MSPRRPLHAVLAALALLLACAPAAPAAVPTATGLPVVTGEYRVGHVLKSTNGTWSGAPTPTYAVSWLRCDLDGTGCSLIAAANGSQYTLAAADLGTTIRSRVRATNIDGTTESRSSETPEITAAQPPVNTVAPSVTGTAEEGATLTAADGTWTGPGTITKTRKWIRCDVALVTCGSW